MMVYYDLLNKSMERPAVSITSSCLSAIISEWYL